MQRLPQDPRPDRLARARRMGFVFAEIEGEPYWDETAYYRFAAAEVDTPEAATAELEARMREAADHAVRHGLNRPLGIPDGAWALVRRSWERQEPSLYGRMDLRWDGAGPPRLLEYNADTPTALFEAAAVQWEWLESSAFPGPADQFNAIHERLIAARPRLGLPGRVHFACARDSAEDRGTVDYLRDTALQAGLEAPFLHLDEIGWDGRGFRDLEEQPIAAIFKLYPWDWPLREAFGRHIGAAATRWIEPAWRLVPSSKAFLSLLWHLFPDHPNLLPAFLEPGRTGGPEIAKPLFGREGANILAPGLGETPGPYGDQPRVWQAYAELPAFAGRYPVLGSWAIAGEPAGLGIREDATPITRDSSRFVPHLFAP
ncbi:glutathionylspermidine synthase family protein [Caldovatus aquaticus]|uniref:Glutathionylspermidine synthase family protein n=1 Tax=Caldovatus aquaticus TaxID=2865671 RepID=A0ABS7EXD6_9PROT|nr:glutathionylspermidine synthase family protein [Caldovatus aquaticus]MBW8268022.1 glutathionylspermidine synthase family protein [Caldovatus aquaticus]